MVLLNTDVRVPRRGSCLQTASNNFWNDTVWNNVEYTVAAINLNLWTLWAPIWALLIFCCLILLLFWKELTALHLHPEERARGCGLFDYNRQNNGVWATVSTTICMMAYMVSRKQVNSLCYGYCLSFDCKCNLYRSKIARSKSDYQNNQIFLLLGTKHMKSNNSLL